MGQSEHQFVKVATTGELPEGTMKLVSVAGKDVLLANVGGSYYAVLNRCTHLGGSLVKGVLADGVVTCPRHGAQFDIRTGQAVGPAKLGFVKMNVHDQKTFSVKVEGTDISVAED